MVRVHAGGGGKLVQRRLVDVVLNQIGDRRGDGRIGKILFGQLLKQPFGRGSGRHIGRQRHQTSSGFVWAKGVKGRHGDDSDWSDVMLWQLTVGVSNPFLAVEPQTED